MNYKQKKVVQLNKEEKVFFLIITFMMIVVGILSYIYQHTNSDFECSVSEYYQGNYSKALTEINNSDENSIRKIYIRGLINYKLNKYQESLKDLNVVSQNMKSIDNIFHFFFVDYKNLFKEHEYYNQSEIEAFILTNEIKSECKFYLKDGRFNN